MSTLLADGNLLIALIVVDHMYHGPAVDWFATEEPTLATCPITEGTLLRFLMREGSSASVAIGVLDAIRAAVPELEQGVAREAREVPVEHDEIEALPQRIEADPDTDGFELLVEHRLAEEHGVERGQPLLAIHALACVQVPHQTAL